MTEELYISLIRDLAFRGTSRSDKKGFLYFGIDPTRGSVKVTLKGKKNFTEEDQKKWTKLLQNAEVHVVITGRFKRDLERQKAVPSMYEHSSLGKRNFVR